MKQNKKKADNDNHSIQLNKNNPEFGNSRNDKSKSPSEKTNQDSVPKEKDTKENFKSQ